MSMSDILAALLLLLVPLRHSKVDRNNSIIIIIIIIIVIMIIINNHNNKYHRRSVFYINILLILKRQLVWESLFKFMGAKSRNLEHCRMKASLNTAMTSWAPSLSLLILLFPNYYYYCINKIFLSCRFECSSKRIWPLLICQWQVNNENWKWWNKRLYCYTKIVSKCFKVYLDADVIRVAKVC